MPKTMISADDPGLFKKEGLFLEIARNIREIFWVRDAESGKMLYLSPGVEDIFGIPLDTLYQNPYAFVEVIHPDDVKKVRKAHERQMKDGKHSETEYRIIRPDGKTRWIRARTSTLKDDMGKASRVIGIAEDITDRKGMEEALQRAYDELEARVLDRTEKLSLSNEALQEEISERKLTEEALKKAYDDLKNVQAQLVQARKLSSIGELASGVAHELNQPLMVIRGRAQLVLRRQRKDSQNTTGLLEDLKTIEKNTKRMMNIINRLQAFSRQAKGAFTPVDVNMIIQESFMMIGEQLKLRNIEVIPDFATDLPKVLGDPNQLEQVFLNLLTNARDAIGKFEGRLSKDEPRREEPGKDEGRLAKGEPRVGKIEIVTKYSLSNQQSPIANQQSGGFVEIRVKDNGCGIPMDKRAHIFDLFFTSKEVGKGTGLGLFISYGIIQNHKGEIIVAETGPEGTTFRITLPVHGSENPAQN